MSAITYTGHSSKIANAWSATPKKNTDGYFVVHESYLCFVLGVHTKFQNSGRKVSAEEKKTERENANESFHYFLPSMHKRFKKSGQLGV
jgi:hypothetical protein